MQMGERWGRCSSTVHLNKWWNRQYSHSTALNYIDCWPQSLFYSLLESRANRILALPPFGKSFLNETLAIPQLTKKLESILTVAFSGSEGGGGSHRDTINWPLANMAINLPSAVTVIPESW